VLSNSSLSTRRACIRDIAIYRRGIGRLRNDLLQGQTLSILPSRLRYLAMSPFHGHALDGSTTDHGLLHRTAIPWCGLKLPRLAHVGGTARVSTTKHAKHTKKRQKLKFEGDGPDGTRYAIARRVDRRRGLPGRFVQSIVCCFSFVYFECFVVNVLFFRS
jgi:hypothetical protein